MNGTLNPDEKALVERAVATDEDLAAELEELRQLHTAIKALPDDKSSAETEDRLRKMMTKIEGLSQLTESDH